MPFLNTSPPFLCKIVSIWIENGKHQQQSCRSTKDFSHGIFIYSFSLYVCHSQCHVFHTANFSKSLSRSFSARLDSIRYTLALLLLVVLYSIKFVGLCEACCYRILRESNNELHFIWRKKYCKQIANFNVYYGK